MKFFLLPTFFMTICIHCSALPICAASEPPPPPGSSVDWRTGPFYYSMLIAEKDIPKYEKGALCGDRIMAWQLASHYQFVAFDDERSLKWTAVAAENGLAEAQHSYALKLMKRKQPGDLERANFWLRKAAAQGLSVAKEELHPSPLRISPSQPLPDPFAAAPHD